MALRDTMPGRKPIFAEPMTARERQRRSRSMRKAARLAAPAEPQPDPVAPDDPVAALAAWSTECLTVPPGHTFPTG